MDEITAKVIAYMEHGCSQVEGEYMIEYKPDDYMNMSYLRLLEESAEEWLSEIRMEPEVTYSTQMAYVREHDGAGAVTADYFKWGETEVMPWADQTELRVKHGWYEGG